MFLKFPWLRPGMVKFRSLTDQPIPKYTAGIWREMVWRERTLCLILRIQSKPRPPKSASISSPKSVTSNPDLAPKAAFLYKILRQMCTLTSFAGLLVLGAFSVESKPSKRKLSFASSFVGVPVMSNIPGLFGAVWKTKVSILNPTDFSYPIQVILYDKTGKVGDITLMMSLGQIRNYDNFLADVFNYGGAGTVKFDSQSIAGGSDNNQFLVDAQVYIVPMEDIIPQLQPTFILHQF